jgi:histidinol-phosphate phosphatase family protein
MFIDRDGTLNRDKGHIYHPDQIQLLPGAAAAVRALNRAGVLAVVITNQAVLARGLCSFADFQQIQGRLELELGAEGAFLDGTFFCPHYPIRGYPGEITSLKVGCGCRKPKTGLVKAACRRLPIDLGRSAVVGDSITDIDLADRLNLPSYWISPPTQDLQYRTMSVASLQEAVSHWLRATADGC